MCKQGREDAYILSWSARVGHGSSGRSEGNKVCGAASQEGIGRRDVGRQQDPCIRAHQAAAWGGGQAGKRQDKDEEWRVGI